MASGKKKNFIEKSIKAIDNLVPKDNEKNNEKGSPSGKDDGAKNKGDGWDAKSTAVVDADAAERARQREEDLKADGERVLQALHESTEHTQRVLRETAEQTQKALADVQDETDRQMREIDEAADGALEDIRAEADAAVPLETKEAPSVEKNGKDELALNTVEAT
uniref:Uncharacterized protein n=1 Tax=Amphora coffeiformis TaxID=265554 RepID=A0A7S3L647_9STRA|mmetsp:Transcript_9721/g.18606  ORF Transcript_9721/g.18606 Transcript_9721/m.18606 type:complete len:164 (-) Transcript_9721:218-709(-)|eukprot:scaffold2069_cov187-Amphora_coffeaeformis.AAC.12